MFHDAEVTGNHFFNKKKTNDKINCFLTLPSPYSVYPLSTYLRRAHCGRTQGQPCASPSCPANSEKTELGSGSRKFQAFVKSGVIYVRVRSRSIAVHSRWWVRISLPHRQTREAPVQYGLRGAPTCKIRAPCGCMCCAKRPARIYS